VTNNILVNMDDCLLADFANFNDILTGQGSSSDEDVTNLNSSLFGDVFPDGGGDLEGDLDSLLSSLTPPSSHSDTSSSPGANFDHDEDFRMTDILGYVLDDSNNAAVPITGLEDHDYFRSSDHEGQDASHEDTTHLNREDHTRDEEVMVDDTVEEEVVVEDGVIDENLAEEQKVEEIVVQTVQIVPQRPTTRKYITILPAQSKAQVKLIGSQAPDADSSSAESTTSPVPYKRRKLQGTRQLKAYPALILTPEEKELCQKDGIVLPEYYPLTKSEESDLRKIRRKIRNKISAQKSRGRKKEYVDDMEARAKLSETENKQLKKKVAVLEAQNRTLVTQLQKMKSLLGSSKAGLGGQKSATALMVLLLSTALFAVPGFKEQYGGKSDLGTAEMASTPAAGITPRASRSLLHYIGNGELSGSYPNVGSAPRSTKNNAQMHDSIDYQDKEKTKLDLMESLNFSKELLENIRRQQDPPSDTQLTNKTKIVTTPEVKSYSNKVIM